MTFRKGYERLVKIHCTEKLTKQALDYTPFLPAFSPLAALSPLPLGVAGLGLEGLLPGVGLPFLAEEGFLGVLGFSAVSFGMMVHKKKIRTQNLFFLEKEL